MDENLIIGMAEYLSAESVTCVNFVDPRAPEFLLMQSMIFCYTCY